MNEIVNQFLLTGDKVMPELHLTQPGFTLSACGPFTRLCGRIKKFRETANLIHIYKHKLYKACFSHDTVYADSRDLVRELFQIKF